jgi:aminopeptidase YwaD
MHKKSFHLLLFFFSLLFFSSFLLAQAPVARTGVVHHPRAAGPNVCADCIRAHEDFLASDALNGRGSATHDELLAATYIASELEQYGVAPLGDDGGYLQRVTLEKKKPVSAPEVSFSLADGAAVAWKHGAEFVLRDNEKTETSGPLQKLQSGAAIQKGAFVLLANGGAPPSEEDMKKATDGGAAAILSPATARQKAHWDVISKRLFEGSISLPSETGAIEGGTLPMLILSEDALAQLAKVADGTVLHLSAPMAETETISTWNVVGVIRGSDASLQKKAVLFSAHLDHLGVGAAVNGDSIYNGADDDASGVTAVLELARVLGSGARPRRTVLFALFGSEELGGLGSQYFREHPPVPLTEIAANLEFEMIGRPDAAVKPDQLWLTGWERSNLGPTLAIHGAKLVGDPHPKEQFFMRSDNYELALKGVVAQTISSYGLHADYHQPGDDVAHLDFKHMDQAIGSLLGPVEWLVNSAFVPEWVEGGRP